MSTGWKDRTEVEDYHQGVGCGNDDLPILLMEQRQDQGKGEWGVTPTVSERQQSVSIIGEEQKHKQKSDLKESSQATGFEKSGSMAIW